MVSSSIWGNQAWHFIHLMAIAEMYRFDKSRLHYYKIFFETLSHTLPCNSCNYNMKQHLKELPNIESFQNDRELFYWTVDLHNLVNKQLNKPEWIHDQAFAYWLDISRKTQEV